MKKIKQSLSRRLKGGSSRSASPAPPPPTAAPEPSAPESSARESSPLQSSAPEISVPNLQGQLWNQAYDAVKADEPKIVEAYERLLSELQNDASGAPASNEYAEQERQMQQLVELGLQRTEKAAALTKRVGDGLKTIMTVKDLVKNAVQAAPAAAVAWVGVCFALEVLSNSFTEASTNREGLAYVVSRMDWYWNLVDLLFDSGAKTELAGLRGRLEVHITKLYQELLLYQMKSVCLFHQNQGVVFFKNSIKLDDWKGQLDGIKATEAALFEDSKQYNSQRVHKHLQDLANIAEGQRDKLELMTSAIQDQTSRQEQMHQDEKDSECLRALCGTDPRHDKTRIQDNKGGLLRDSYTWVLDNPNFKEWQTNVDCGLLWIRGDPGKGKTMLLCGILDELERHSTSQQAYFFCQETNRNLNNATAVLRGLIFSLVRQQPKLISHVRKEYDPVGQKLFEGSNVWEAMSKILTAVLDDSTLHSTVLIVDALDECGEGRDKLLKLITTLSMSPCIKWAVSSRNWPEIQEHLNTANQKVTLHLELNMESISAAVKSYIKVKVSELTKRKHYNEAIRATIEQTFIANADSTFLWVALVYEELLRAPRWKALDILKTIPSGLNPLYERMMRNIRDSGDEELCTQLLAVASAVYQPVSLEELTAILELPPYFDSTYADLETLVASCGSLLTLQRNIVSFVHQSAKDFLLSKETVNQILPYGIQHQHRTILSRSVKILSETLRRDIYQLKKPGASISMSLPSPDPLAPIRYSCTYWVDHLQDADIMADLTQRHLRDDGTVHEFLRRNYLYWLEAECLTRDLSGAILALQKVETLVTKVTSSQKLSALVRDAIRFVHWCRRGIETTPLQLYASSLFFCPRQSLVRILFQSDAFNLIQSPSQMPADWDYCVQTLEGHEGHVSSIAFAPGGRLASASTDFVVKVWDLASGVCTATLEDHRSGPNSVAFAPDEQLASASSDFVVKVWDLTTGACTATLEDHSRAVTSVAFAPDGRLASGSDDKTVKVWDLTTSVCIATLEGHGGAVNSVTFAPDGRLASGSDDKTVKIWDPTTSVCIATLEGHGRAVSSVAFAPDGRLASGSDDKTVKVWDPTTTVCIATLGGHGGGVNSVTFAPDGRLASGSDDKTVKVWDPTTTVCIATLEGHVDIINSVAFTVDGSRLASGSDDQTVKIWDPAMAAYRVTFEGHRDYVTAVAFTLDRRRFASASHDGTVKVWDPATGVCTATLEGHGHPVRSVAFTPDGLRLASGSVDKTVKIWDLVTAVCVATLEGHTDWVRSVAFTPDKQWLASGSDDHTVKVWDSTTGACVVTLEGHFDWVSSVVFAPDGQRLASASYDNTVKLWDPAMGVCVQTLNVESVVYSLAFSSATDFELNTDYDTLSLQPWATDHESQEVSLAPQHTHNLSVSRGLDWICKDREAVLWLPSEYRPQAWSAVEVGSLLVIGCSSGRVMFYT